MGISKRLEGPITVTLAVLVGVLFVVVGAQAATTIGTSITTAGALDVTGQTTLAHASSTMFSAYSVYFGGAATTTISSAGAVAIGGTLNVTGLSTLGNATSTMFSAYSVYFGGAATTTISSAGAVAIGGTLNVTGQTTLGQASSTILSANSVAFGGAASTTISAAGAVAMGGTLGVTGLATLSGGATTTTLIVGTGSASTVSGIAFGFCTATVNVSATSTAFASCTGATGVTASDRIFVMATSSLPTQVLVQAASSSAANVIQLQVFNTGVTGGAVNTPISFNFWAVR